MKKKRWKFARVTRRDAGVELVAGLEMLPGESLDTMYLAVKTVLGQVTDLQMQTLTDDQLNELVVGMMELRFKLNTRSFFLEVGRGSLDEYVQVYQE